MLRAAKRDFLSVINKVYPDDSSSLEKTECGLVVYYLEAVVLLKHHQLPGVVEHMTVSIIVLIFCLYCKFQLTFMPLPVLTNVLSLFLCRYRSGLPESQTPLATESLA